MKLLSKHLYPKEYQEYQDEQLEKLIRVSKAQLEKGQGADFEKILLESKKNHGIL